MRIKSIAIACLLAATTAYCGPGDGGKKGDSSADKSASKSEAPATVQSGEFTAGLMEVTVTALTMRSQPNEKAATVSCDLQWGANAHPLTNSSPEGKAWVCDGPACEAKNQVHLPKGTRVTTLERTKDQVTVGKYTNYWYKIDLSGEKSNPGCRKNPGKTAWVFGEFLKAAKE